MVTGVTKGLMAYHHTAVIIPGSPRHVLFFNLRPGVCMVFNKVAVCPGFVLQPVRPSVVSYSGVSNEGRGIIYQFMAACQYHHTMFARLLHMLTPKK